MKKLGFILTLALCMALVLSLSSCDVISGILGSEEEKPPCADGHSFSEEWSYDSVQHWHKAICEHSDVKGGLAMHSYVDGACVCGAIEPSAHQHIYSTVWSYDAVSHWHAATCEHSDLRLDEAEHSYVGGVCICGAEEPHEHTYESKWSTSESKHWHASTCGHNVKGDEGEHEYGEDLICDECGYEHEHTYSEKWESDENKHWKNAICEHSGVVYGEGAHEYGEDLICDVCGYEHEHTYSEKWESDENKHWKNATCEHSGVVYGEAAHEYGADFVCIECGYVHEHSYSDKWTSDKDKHWHASTCGHDVKGDEAAHAYVNSECVCGAIENHEHTYSDEWTSDANNHWHKSTCGHNVKGDEAPHAYGDDFVCDECGYEHEHTYSDKWESDGEGHWHESDCGHAGFITEKVEHAYGDDFVCDECGYEHEHTYSDKWESDASGHWHESDCGHAGFATEKVAHEYGDDFICDECGYEHEHAYSEKWESDGEGHWHESDCGHAGFTTEKVAHEYGDDLICDECGYEHEHTFEEKWSYDENKHWHAATCGHDVRGDEAAHFLGGDDACVSNCGYKYVAPHVHTYSSKWSKDETSHWHAPTCGDTDEVIDKEMHIYGDDDVCDVCEMIKPIIITSSDIAQGGWAYGNSSSKSNRIRVSELISVKKGTVIKYNSNGQEIYLDFPAEPGATSGDRAGWFTGEGEYLIQADCYLGITIAASGRSAAITPSAYACDIVIFPGTGEIEMTYEKRNVYKYKEAAAGDAGNYWCFVYLPEGYDPDRAEPYSFVIANHGNGWNMDGSAKKANWTDVCMYMSATEIAAQSASKQSRYIETDDASLWYSNPTIEALLAAGYIVCGAQNYGDNLYGNDDCTNACVDFFNHMTETYNVEDACYMMGASNGAMTTLNAVAKLGNKVKSIILHYPLASVIEQYLSGNHQDSIEAAYGLDTAKTYTEAELVELIGEYDVLHHNVVNGVKQGYFPSVQIYYSSTDETTPASANAIPLMDMLHASGIEYDGVRIDTDGTNKPHGHVDHFDPESCVEWFEAH